MLICCLGVTASADEVKKPILRVSNISAIPGDVIVVDVSMEYNPGIMAMTFTLCYDNKALTFNKYKRGVFSDYTVVNHGDRGYVSFVNCESNNREHVGTIFSVEFTVKDNTQVGEYPLEIKHIRPDTHGSSMQGCFADWQGSKIVPVINNGKLIVGYTGTNCRHSFNDWSVTVPPLCEETGVNTRTCIICGHSVTSEIEPIGHSFEKHWTVDRVATDTASGLLTRHCSRCAKVTDKVTFTVKESEDNGFKNQLDEQVMSTEWKKLSEIEKENEQKENQEQNSSNSEETPEATTPETNNPSEDISEPDEQEKEPDIPENADQLINTAKKPMGLGARLYRLFFGTQTQDGIFDMIKKQMPTDLKTLFSNKFVIIIFFIVTAIL